MMQQAYHSQKQEDQKITIEYDEEDENEEEEYEEDDDNRVQVNSAHVVMGGPQFLSPAKNLPERQ